MQDTVGRELVNEKTRTELINIAALGRILLVFRKKPLLLQPHS
jgi:hypothetical protein